MRGERIEVVRCIRYVSLRGRVALRSRDWFGFQNEGVVSVGGRCRGGIGDGGACSRCGGVCIEYGGVRSGSGGARSLMLEVVVGTRV